MKKQNYIFIFIYILLIVLITYSINGKKKEEVEKFKQENYLSIIENTKTQLITLIKEKQNSTASIGISLTSHSDITDALKNHNGDLVDLKDLSLKLKENTDFKNVWFQLISKNGISLQRSWSKKKGDKIADARVDIRQMLISPKIMNTISVGRFDLTFKSMSPVFDGNKNFLGIIEVITHFNSISKQLANKNTNAIILADKRYEKQLVNAFTNNFVDGYYVANLDAQTKLLRYLKEKRVKDTIDSLSKNIYIIDKEINSIVSYHKLLNIKGQDMAHFIMFDPLHHIEPVKIKNIKYIYNLYIFLAITFLSLLFYFLYSVKSAGSNKKNSPFKILSIIILIYLLISTVTFKLIETKYDNDIEEYNTNVQHQVLLEYQSIISKNRDIAGLIFSSYLQKERVIELFKNKEREKLYNHINKLYFDLQQRYNIRQLHFHLPDSTSFLRMHKPKKYGDSLKGIRQSVDFVNNYLKPYYGFEEGRVFNGFRHVFPLFDKDNIHLGSVEIGFDIYSFIDSYLNLFDAKRVNLLIKKSIVERKVFNDERNNYIDSPIKGFYFDKLVIKKLHEKSKDIIPHRKNTDDLENIAKYINEGKSFFYYFSNINEIVIIKPLINKITGEVLGSINISKDDRYIKNKLKEFYTLSIIILTILAFVMVFIYREIISKQKIESEFEKNQKILDSQNSFIIITDGKKIKTSNRSMLDFFGYTSLSDFRKDNNCICERFLKDSGSEYIQRKMGSLSWFEYIRENKDKHMKVKIKDKKGKDFVFKIEYNKYSFNDEEFIITFVDVTDLEEINQKLQNTTNSQKQLLSLFDKGEIILFKWDITNNYKTDYVSSNVEKLLGYTQNEFLNYKLTYFDIIDPKDEADVIKMFVEKTDIKEEFFIHPPYRVITKNNEYKYVINNSITIKDKNNEISHILSYIIDISHLKDMEQQLIEQEKMASLGSMIGNIAHQWRQPLSAITTASSAMSVESEFGIINEQKIHHYNDTILKNAEFLSHTIDTFRNFLKEDKKVQEVVIQDRINIVLDIFDATLKNHHIKLIKNIEESEPIKKQLPLGELTQVVTNLLNNAKDIILENKIKEPWVKIDCYETNMDIIVRIEDNGGGIPEDVIGKIFEPYFTTKHQSQGTGLGLYMSHKIVHENLKGKLFAKNSENGAVFYIQIPRD